MIPWCIKLLQKYRKGADIHSFCLDFASALLANLLHASSTLERLESDERQTTEILNDLLSLIVDEDAGNAAQPEGASQQLPTSSIIHCLICLSYLSKERFAQSLEAT